jgi:hypothetical protein
MQQRWSRLLRDIGEFRRLLKEHQLILLGPPPLETGSAEAALADCKSRLVEVLLPESEHSRLVNQLNNAHAYFTRGVTATIAMEAHLARIRSAFILCIEKNMRWDVEYKIPPRALNYSHVSSCTIHLDHPPIDENEKP